MNRPATRVSRARRLLSLVVISTALLWGLCVASAVRVMALLTRLAVPLTLGARQAFAVTGLAAALAVGGWVLWRGRKTRSSLSTALWIEEHDPSLRYALVTAVAADVAGPPLSSELLAAAERADIEGLVRRTAERELRHALTGVAILGAALWLVARSAHRAGEVDGTGGLADRPPIVVPNRLIPLAAEVRPPSYSRLPALLLWEPEVVAALAGTEVSLRGDGSPDGVTAEMASDSLTAAGRADGWRVTFRLPVEPTVLVLHDRTFRRLVSLEPRPDSIPEVVLRAPAHDTTYQSLPLSPLQLEAHATDDLGLAVGYWELLITTGAGEQFETVARQSRRAPLGGAREATFRLSLRLDTLKLTPGSVVNLRAVALDANDLTGPGRGVSETRTIRIAAPMDSSAAAAEPPIPIDSMWISQRLLNLRTDTLWSVRGRLTRAVITDRAMSYSNTQQQIRERVIAVIALLEDDGMGGSAPTDESRRLREAAEAMLEARLRLAMAEVDSARPPMRKALAILDEIRTARRYHMRGVLRPPPVDVARARLTGTDRGEPAAAAGRPPLTALDRQLAERLQQFIRLYRSDPQGVTDSLVFLRASLLLRRPELARILTQGLDRLRAGTGIAVALAPARLQLSSAPVRLSGPAEWAGGNAP